MTALTRKLLRDLWHMKGQAFAISLVVGSGVATFVMALNTLESLKNSRIAYYERYRFAEVFAQLKRAPDSLAERIAEIPGVARVQTRVVEDVNLDVAGMAEPAVGRLISIPEDRMPILNDLHLRSGRYIEPGRPGEVLVSEAFAQGHHLQPGDHVLAVINGHRQLLQIVGVALSPEYIISIQAGGLIPDDRRFGVFWMGYRELASAFDMYGAFNDVSLTLMAGASEPDVIRRLDLLTEPYGGLGAFGREDQVSHRYLSDEMSGLRTMGTIAPAIFLGVAAFLLNAMLSRIIATQREDIAMLKAFGYSNLQVGRHYLDFALVIVAVGMVLGTTAGMWLGHGLTDMYARFYRFPLSLYQVHGLVVALGFLVSLAAAVVGVSGAVRRAVRLPPAEAMRPEPPADYRPTLVERVGLQRLFSQPSRMILRHLERQPVKALLSCFGISLAAAILVVGSFMKDSLDAVMDLQFRKAQRQDVMLSLVEPASAGALDSIDHLPGVRYAEPFRSVPVRLRYRQHTRRAAIMGLERAPDLYRVLGDRDQSVPLPAAGLLMSAELARRLEARVGDRITVEVLDGRRPVRDVPLAGLVPDTFGLNVYMRLPALHALLQEGGSVSGAFLETDPTRTADLFRSLKETPRVAAVTLKEAALRNFQDTVGENLMRMRLFNMIFASIIAFGVVYNSARISLSERSRELATLRVMGFTRAEISMILLGEMAVLTLAAIPFGLVLGYGMAGWLASSMDTELFRLPWVVARSTYGFAVAVVLAAALFSALVVRRKLDYLDLVAVLKARD
jgi:putative ABC transport system permease protein